MDDKVRIDFKKGEKAAKYSGIINFLLAIIKGVVGFYSGSIALIADSIHSFSDIVTSLAVYIGLKLSSRKPDEMFPYGYYKIETLTSLIVSILIILTGSEIALESYNDFLNPVIIEIPLISLSVAAFSAVVSFLLAKYKERVGRAICSQALINDGKHSFIDIFASIIVFIGILSSYLGYLRIQGIAGIFVAILIIYIGLKLAKDDVLVLLDAGMSPQKIKEIESIVLGIEGVEGVHNVKVRRSGPFIFAELHLETKKELKVKRAYELSSTVKKLLKEKIKNLDNIIVQLEPYKTRKFRIAIPVETRDGMHSELSDHFARAPFILIADVFEDKIIDVKIKDNPGANFERKKGIKTAEFLGDEKVDILVNPEVREGPMYVLSNELIDTVEPEGKDLEEIIRNALKNKNEVDLLHDDVPKRFKE